LCGENTDLKKGIRGGEKKTFDRGWGQNLLLMNERTKGGSGNTLRRKLKKKTEGRKEETKKMKKREKVPENRKQKGTLMGQRQSGPLGKLRQGDSCG